VNDRQLIDMAHYICELPEYRRKELAILILSSLLNPEAVEQLAGYMAGLSELRQERDQQEEELLKQAEAQSRMEEEEYDA
jgi:hypothetical protein